MLHKVMATETRQRVKDQADPYLGRKNIEVCKPLVGNRKERSKIAVASEMMAQMQ